MQRTIDVAALREQMAGGNAPLIIDVRSHDEYDSGHIPFAVNIPLEEVDHRLDDLPPHTPVVLVCNSGDRAGICFERLSTHRDDVMVLEGGTMAWIADGADVVRVTRTSWAIERQVRLAAGILVLIGTVLTAFGAAGWLYLAMFIGAGLMFSGITNFCGMAKLIAILPWNKPNSKPNSPAINGA